MSHSVVSTKVSAMQKQFFSKNKVLHVPLEHRHMTDEESEDRQVSAVKHRVNCILFADYMGPRKTASLHGT
jgi:hypothetical protein